MHRYLLVGAGNSLLVDAGLSASDDAALREEVRALLGTADPSALLVTHWHIDHTGRVAGFLTRGVPVWLGSVERDRLQARRSIADWPSTVLDWLRRHGVPKDEEETLAATYRSEAPDVSATRPVEAGQRFDVGDRHWTVLALPGHSPGHLGLWEEESRTLIGGDFLLPGETPNISVAPGSEGNPLGEYLESLQRAQSLGIRLLLPGHFAPERDVQAVIDGTRSHHDMRLADALDAVAKGARSAYEAAERMPWSQRKKRFSDLRPFERRLALGEAAAHLRHLATVGEVQEADGRYAL